MSLCKYSGILSGEVVAYVTNLIHTSANFYLHGINFCDHYPKLCRSSFFLSKIHSCNELNNPCLTALLKCVKIIIIFLCKQKIFIKVFFCTLTFYVPRRQFIQLIKSLQIAKYIFVTTYDSKASTNHASIILHIIGR